MKSNDLQTLSLTNFNIEDDFWSEYIRLVREVIVPYQWEALNDRVEGAEPSHAIRNFRIAAGEEQGEFYGMVFQDSDVAKWLEAVGYLLETQPDAELEAVADGVIDTIAKAQQKDGYLNTYFTLKEPGKKWTNLAECHELYCAGHMIEAGVAYYRATGKRKLLDVVTRFADYMDTVFGEGPDQLHRYDGHQEIELALVKLYHATGEAKYLNLSKFFLDQRGQQPHFYEQEWEERGRVTHFPSISIIQDHPYSQSHLPVREQQTAEGHAVRVVYMCTGMADVAVETGDADLLEACRKLWHNIVTKRMYITGGIGSMAHGESFTSDYDLPNDSIYAETCASIGLIFFAQRMLQIEPKSEYADVMERALYNTVVSGMSRDGKHFFYVNPLEVYPISNRKNKNFEHVKSERQGWFGCACCPPNIARLLASLGQYIYTLKDNTLFTHLYIGGVSEWDLSGHNVKLEQHSEYTSNGKVKFTITADSPADFTLALRVPDWSDQAAFAVNGIPFVIGPDLIVDGYVRIKRIWQTGDQVEIVFSMPILRMKGNPLIRHTSGKVALQRGPYVYCLEEVDNGPNLYQLILSKESSLKVIYDPLLLGGINVILAGASRLSTDEWDEQLYRHDAEWQTKHTAIRFIPYFAWANRGIGEMTVWIKDS
ncbi:glycoside hydrolase family 127 protein [Paenibacillus psychroresistens]|uniref:Glycoside hydrolase family 127 protein n=1 Tax=Paenibacillus psychroresistens TaxID=1778678 RepID=A0A6B8RFK8_9BACL|nr:beta-L-arabinofuranosidase domain-containing protein [Paenibacillus psychroresistens]QGQ94313.1 glycoside hydrolase family 127 protein [Paenibacillus psychroresistens]